MAFQWREGAHVYVERRVTSETGVNVTGHDGAIVADDMQRGDTKSAFPKKVTVIYSLTRKSPEILSQTFVLSMSGEPDSVSLDGGSIILRLFPGDTVKDLLVKAPEKQSVVPEILNVGSFVDIYCVETNEKAADAVRPIVTKVGNAGPKTITAEVIRKRIFKGRNIGEFLTFTLNKRTGLLEFKADGKTYYIEKRKREGAS